MAAHLTEEEQIEAIKRWWKDNGKFTVALILAVVVGWFGWNSWQDRQERLAKEASRQYSELLAATEAAEEGALSEADLATARTIAHDIIDARPNSLYGNMAALLLARLALDEGELDAAAGQLREAADNAANEAMANLANLRLAKVLLAQGNYDQALSVLEQDVDTAYSAAYAEVRGDVYLAQGDLEQAQTAYRQALNNLSPQQTNRSGILQLKIENTQVAGSAADLDETAPAATPALPAEGDV